MYLDNIKSSYHNGGSHACDCIVQKCSWIYLFNPAHGEVYSIQHYVIQFVSDWWVSLGTPVSPTNKTDHHDITETLFKVALNTITLTLISQCCSLPNTIAFLFLILKNILFYFSSSILETWSQKPVTPGLILSKLESTYHNNVSCHFWPLPYSSRLNIVNLWTLASWQHRPWSFHLYQTKSDIVPCHNYNDSPGYRNILLPGTLPIKSNRCESRIFTIVVERIGIIIHIILTRENQGSFRPSLVHNGLVMSEEKIFEKVYRQRTPRDGKSSHDRLHVRWAKKYINHSFCFI